MSAEAAVWEALARVPDPELPVLSLVDLGVVLDVEVDGARARVRLTPTFVGCPAVDAMRTAIEHELRVLGYEPLVETTFAVPWTSNRISPLGRERLAEAGIAPPGDAPPTGPVRRPLPLVVACPRCGGTSTRRDNAFGPTPCRSLWYCESCTEPFEAFKPL